VRWRRWNFPESVAAAGTDPDANPNSDANTHANTNADADPNADPNANAGRWDHDHHHVRGRVTQDIDRAGGNTCHVREQRHARA